MSDDMDKNLLENEGIVDNNNPIIESAKGNDSSEQKSSSGKYDIISPKIKRIRMYIVLIAFTGLSLLSLFVAEIDSVDKELDKLFNKTALSILIFVLAIIGSLGLCSLVGYLEWLIKTHVLGILFVIILNGLNDYCMLFSSHHGIDLKCFQISLAVLTVGSLGMLGITFASKEQNISIYYLFLFNGIGSLILGVILLAFNSGAWETTITALSFLISEFNIYSSQYQFVVYGNEKQNEKQKKKDILMYSQPFELSLSAFKFIIFFASLIFRGIKFCADCCCGNKEENKGEATTSSEDNKN